MYSYTSKIICGLKAPVNTLKEVLKYLQAQAPLKCLSHIDYLIIRPSILPEWMAGFNDAPLKH